MIDVIKDLAAIAVKHKEKWGFQCDDGQMVIWIADDEHMENYQGFEVPNQCLKIVYRIWDIPEAYFDIANIVNNYSKCVTDDFPGFTVDELKVVVEVMEYIKTNASAINDWIEDNFPYEFAAESAGD